MSVRDILMAAGGVDTGGAADDYFKNVTLLLNGDGTNGAQNNTFLDSSTNAFSITRNGNTTQGSFSPYGSLWSNYFPRDGSGTSRQYLYTGSNISGISGDFTLECWVSLDDITSDNVLFGLGNSASSGFFARVEYKGASGPNTLNFYSGGDYYFDFPSVLTNNTWNHIAVTRQSNTLKVWLNGTQLSTTRTLATSFSSDVFYIGAGKLNTTVPYNPNKGYMSNVRLVNGTAVYTSNFTPSTTPLTAITNTAVLTCQSNRFIDNSSNNYSIIPSSGTSASVSVQRFSPFNPTASYDTATIGGSGYFDGSTAFLNTANTSQPTFSGDFTIGGWFYPTSMASYQTFATNYKVNNSTEWTFDILTTGQLNLYVNGLNTVRISSAAGAIKPYQWNYIAMVRSGSVVTLYINGTSQGTYSTSVTVGAATTPTYIGNYVNTQYVTGYISDFVMTATASSSIPSSPTPSSGTSLLLNMTNAGIPDYAMINDLQTVGNAQVSTSVKKFGTGSLAFDGTGDYLIARNSPDFNLGTGDFTIEAWVYLTNTTGQKAIVSKGIDTGTKYGAYDFLFDGTTLRAYLYDSSGTSTTYSATSGVSATTWTHVAAVRYSGTFKIYVNGVSIVSGASTQNLTGDTDVLWVGAEQSSSANFNGYIDDLRITKGYARYTTTFTPPTAALPTK